MRVLVGRENLDIPSTGWRRVWTARECDTRSAYDRAESDSNARKVQNDICGVAANQGEEHGRKEKRKNPT